MKTAYLVAVAAAALVTSGASAETVPNTSLQNVNGQFGTSTAVTTTTATGTRTTVVGSGPNAGANRASGTPVFNQWYQANVGAGSTVGITTDYARSGNGSAYFNSTQGDTGKGDLVYLFGNSSGNGLQLIDLASLSNISFDFFRSVASTTDPNLAPVMRLSIAKDGRAAGSLVFENVYQQQQPSPVNSWTTLSGDLNSGIFWATSSSLGATFASANDGQNTLQHWIDDNRGSNLAVYGLEIGIGSGWQGTFFGGVDNVAVSFGDGPSVNANFEVAGGMPAVPEPATWGMMLLGFGALGAMLRRRPKAAAQTRYA